MMERKTISSALIIVSINAIGCCVSAYGADDGGGTVNCSSIASQKPDDDQALETWKENQRLCALIDQRKLKNLLDATKSEGLAKALSGFSAISGMSGVVSNPGAADHIGDWLAQYALARASRQLSQKVAAQINSPVLLVTDTSVLSMRPQLKSTLTYLTSYDGGFSSLNSLAEKVIAHSGATVVASGDKGVEFGLIEALSLVPPAFNAAEQVAAAVKTNSSLSPLSVTSKPEVILAGLTQCMGSRRGNILIPAFRSEVNNDLTDAYKNARLAYMQAKVNSEKLKSLADQLQKDKKKTPELDEAISLKTKLDLWISQFEELDSHMKSTPTGSALSVYEILIGVADTLNEKNLLFVTVAHFGASGGTLSSKWRSDRLSYRATVHLNYLLTDKSGVVLDGGSVVDSTSAIIAPDADLATVIRTLPPLECTIQGG